MRVEGGWLRVEGGGWKVESEKSRAEGNFQDGNRRSSKPLGVEVRRCVVLGLGFEASVRGWAGVGGRRVQGSGFGV